MASFGPHILKFLAKVGEPRRLERARTAAGDVEDLKRLMGR